MRYNHRKLPLLLCLILTLCALSRAQDANTTAGNENEYDGLSNDQASALCVSMIDNCPEKLANKTSHCQPNRFFFAQPKNCTLTACEYCAENSSKGINYCVKSWTILFRCPEILKSWSTARPTPSTSQTSTPSLTPTTTSTSSASSTPTPSLSASVSPSISPSSSITPSPSDNSTLVFNFDEVIETILPSPETESDSEDDVDDDEDSDSAQPLPNPLPDSRAAAICISSGKNCDKNTATRSGSCTPSTFVKKQAQSCVSAACEYCRTPFGRLENICTKSWAINTYCNISSSTGTGLLLPTDNNPSFNGKNLSANALCVSRAKMCRQEDADNSFGCTVDRLVMQQSVECVQGACQWCFDEQNRDNLLCRTNWAIQIYCYGSPKPSPLPSKTAMPPSATPSRTAELGTTSTQPSATVSASASVSVTASMKVTASVSVSVSSSVSASTSQSSSPSASVSVAPSPTSSVTPSTSATVTSTTSATATSSTSPTPTSTATATPTTTTSSTSTPSPLPLDATQCLWMSNDRFLAIPLSDINPTSFWQPYKDDFVSGIEWRRGQDHKWTDPPGVGKLCFRAQFSKPGTYYFTAYTMAKHWSEHNDMWVSFSHGFNLFKADTMIQQNLKNAQDDRLMKAYQNSGNNVLTDILSSVNFNPHVFVSKYINAGDLHELCISGRSSQFKVIKLVMVQCEGMQCKRSSSHIRSAMRDIFATDHVSKSQC